MNIPGDRPDAQPVDRGQFESEVVYMRGDVVTDDEGRRWRALADFRSGLLPPSLVATDRPGDFWEVWIPTAEEINAMGTEEYLEWLDATGQDVDQWDEADERSES